MTQAEKLEALIQKAIESGFDWFDIKDYANVCGKCGDRIGIGYDKYLIGRYHDEDGGKIKEVVKLPGYYPEDDSDYITIVWHDKTESLSKTLSYSDIIFNHDFARALFGEEEITVAMAKKDLQVGFVTTEDVYEPYPVKVFKYHLQQAVISPNPIDYMYKTVFDD